MTDREKLIALLRETEITKINGRVALAKTCFTPVVFEKMAGSLIANGVKIPGLCQDCKQADYSGCASGMVSAWSTDATWTKTNFTPVEEGRRLTNEVHR